MLLYLNLADTWWKNTFSNSFCLNIILQSTVLQNENVLFWNWFMFKIVLVLSQLR